MSHVTPSTPLRKAKEGRIELTFQMDKDGAAPAEAEAERVAQALRKALPTSDSVRREAGGRLSVVIAVPCSRQLLEDLPEAGRMNLEEDTRKSVETYQRLLEGKGSLGLHHVDACAGYQYDADRWRKAVAGERVSGYVLKKCMSTDRSGNSRSEDLLLVEKPVVDGTMVEKAVAERGEPGYHVSVQLTPQGAARLTQHTDPANVVHDRDRLAIVLNDEVRTAPIIQAQLGGMLQITGNFTAAEANVMAGVLNVGSFPCRLKLVGSRRLQK